MEEKEKEHFRHLLKKIKRDLKRGIEKIDNEERRSIKNLTGELSTYDNHPADVGSETFEREKDHAVRYGISEILELVEKALSNLENGNYGNCKKCGTEIGKERLDTVPYTPYCKECAEWEEQYVDRGDRPFNTEKPAFSFSNSFTDEEINVSYDGEDTIEEIRDHGDSTN